MREKIQVMESECKRFALEKEELENKLKSANIYL
jgi:hypothetical protein